MQEAELERLAKAREQELNYKKQMDSLEVEKQAQLSDIESKRFHRIMESLGGDTLREIARAGPELQVRLQTGAFGGGALKMRCD